MNQTQAQAPLKSDVDGDEHGSPTGDGDSALATGDAVEVHDTATDEWRRAMVATRISGDGDRVRVRYVDAAQTQRSQDVEVDAATVRLTGSSPSAHRMKTPPPALDVALSKRSRLNSAKKRRLPQVPSFGAALSQQRLGEFGAESLRVPETLLLLRAYLVRFDGFAFEGIFANGRAEHVLASAAAQFAEEAKGAVSRVDFAGVRKLVESGRVERHEFRIGDDGQGDSAGQRHYAMLFAELIKLWLAELPQPLLQKSLPSTFFGDIGDVEDLERELDLVGEPRLSTLLFVWDLCAEASSRQEVNHMTPRRASSSTHGLMPEPAAPSTTWSECVARLSCSTPTASTSGLFLFALVPGTFLVLF